MNDPGAVIAGLEAALAREGAIPERLEELGRLKLAAGDSAGAISAYEQCIACAPPSAGLYNNLGAALLKAGRFTQSIQALEAALALKPGYPRALVNMGKALR